MLIDAQQGSFVVGSLPWQRSPFSDCHHVLSRLGANVVTTFSMRWPLVGSACSLYGSEESHMKHFFSSCGGAGEETGGKGVNAGQEFQTFLFVHGRGRLLSDQSASQHKRRKCCWKGEEHLSHFLFVCSCGLKIYLV